jgi:AMP nucleosidase
MTQYGHGAARDLVTFRDAGAAVERITAIYTAGVDAIRGAFADLMRGKPAPPVRAVYPYVGIAVGRSDLYVDARHSYGVLLEPGVYGTTLTHPELFDATTASKSICYSGATAFMSLSARATVGSRCHL